MRVILLLEILWRGNLQIAWKSIIRITVDAVVGDTTASSEKGTGLLVTAYRPFLPVMKSMNDV